MRLSAGEDFPCTGRLLLFEVKPVRQPPGPDGAEADVREAWSASMIYVRCAEGSGILLCLVPDSSTERGIWRCYSSCARDKASSFSNACASSRSLSLRELLVAQAHLQQHRLKAMYIRASEGGRQRVLHAGLCSKIRGAVCPLRRYCSAVCLAWGFRCRCGPCWPTCTRRYLPN